MLMVKSKVPEVPGVLPEGEACSKELGLSPYWEGSWSTELTHTAMMDILKVLVDKHIEN